MKKFNDFRKSIEEASKLTIRKNELKSHLIHILKNNRDITNEQLVEIFKILGRNVDIRGKTFATFEYYEIGTDEYLNHAKKITPGQ